VVVTPDRRRVPTAPPTHAVVDTTECVRPLHDSVRLAEIDRVRAAAKRVDAADVGLMCASRSSAITLLACAEVKPVSVEADFHEVADQPAIGEASSVAIPPKAHRGAVAHRRSDARLRHGRGCPRKPTANRPPQVNSAT